MKENKSKYIIMPIVLNKKLYDLVKEEADQVYKKSSAYKSGFIVKEYKRRGGQYADDGEEKKLKRWYKEKWSDVSGEAYPVYRPSVRVNSRTPLTVDEIDKTNLKKQIKEKQIIKGLKNLSPFIAK